MKISDNWKLVFFIGYCILIIGGYFHEFPWFYNLHQGKRMIWIAIFIGLALGVLHWFLTCRETELEEKVRFLLLRIATYVLLLPLFAEIMNRKLPSETLQKNCVIEQSSGRIITRGIGNLAEQKPAYYNIILLCGDERLRLRMSPEKSTSFKAGQACIVLGRSGFFGVPVYYEVKSISPDV